MSKSRLTRQELSWLLTQEAQNAAERLRVGVQVLRTQAPPPMSQSPVQLEAAPVSAPASLPHGHDPGHDPAHHVDASLDALDDVMRMLSNLNQRPAHAGGGAAPPRRGRIDIAALLVEIAPEARVSIEPGSGTEVFGEEADLRRMLQVLVGHGSGIGAGVSVRRDGDDVRVSVALGPDSSPTAETERVWLSRMALRYGGRHELEGGNEVLVFPAEEAAEASEREKLRRELDEARRQGEAYARELAAMFERGEEVTGISTVPPPPGASMEDHVASMTKLARAMAAEMRNALAPLARELAAVRRHDVSDEQLDTLRRRVAHAHEVTASVAAFGEARPDALAVEVDLLEAARAASRDVTGVAERHEAKIEIRERDRAHVRVPAKTLAAILRGVVEHAAAASPRGGTVSVAVEPVPAGGARLVVDDAGAPLPAAGRKAFLSLATDAGGYGRPSALPLFLAAELASSLGARLELADAPSGGVRVVVTFPRA